MLKRKIGLFLKFLITRWNYRGKVKFNGFTIIYAFPESIIMIGKGTVINSSPLSNLIGLYQRMIIVARYGGKISIGDGCQISASTIYSMKEIIIGKKVFIGGNCKIIDNDFHSLDPLKRLSHKLEDIKKKPITIGDECFIGANCIILKGTTLGRNCVVGAGSVVHGSWPNNSIIAGNPAKVIGINKEQSCLN